MSSPSRIPVSRKSKSSKSQNRDAGRKEKNIKSKKNTKLATTTHEPRTDGPTNANKNSMHNVVQKQKNVADRRGISEIKRSEQNLRNQVKELEKEIKEMKLQIDEMESVVEAQELKENSLQSDADNLIKKNNELTEMNTELCNLIEENQINPVTKEAMSVSDSIKELMQSCKSKSGDQVQTIVGSINALNVLCDETKNRLVTVSCKPTDIY